jgi:hypothetical protein
MPRRQREPSGWLSTIRLQKEEKGRAYFYLQSSFLAWMVSLPFSCGGGGGGGAVGGRGFRNLIFAIRFIRGLSGFFRVRYASLMQRSSPER